MSQLRIDATGVPLAPTGVPQSSALEGPGFGPLLDTARRERRVPDADPTAPAASVVAVELGASLRLAGPLEQRRKNARRNRADDAD